LDVVRVKSKPEFDNNGNVIRDIFGLNDFARLFAEKINEGRSHVRSNAREQTRNLETCVSDSVK
jgi:hypothetical protein